MKSTQVTTLHPQECDIKNLKFRELVRNSEEYEDRSKASKH